MKRLLLLSLIPVALTAAAQPMDHSSMPGMVMPGDTPKQAKKPVKKAAPVAHQGHVGKRASPSGASHAVHMDHSSMPGMKMDHSSMPGMKMPAAGSSSQDHSSMPGMKMDHSSMPDDEWRMANQATIWLGMACRSALSCSAAAQRSRR